MDVIIPHKPQLDSQRQDQLGKIAGVGGLKHFDPAQDLVANHNIPHPNKKNFSTETGINETFSYHNRSIMRNAALEQHERENKRFALEQETKFFNGVGLPPTKNGFFRSV